MVTIQNQDGSNTKYRLLSERLPEFLKAFPISEGFRVIVEAKGLSEVTGNSESQGILFTASLYKDDLVVANASACRLPPSGHKEWEKGETAARQRLLAACGFGGEVLDEDEHSDMHDQGLVLSNKDHGPQSESVQEEFFEPVVTAPTLVSEPEKAKGQNPVAKKQAAPAIKESKTDSPPQNEIPPAILRQIQHQSKLKGVDPVPEPKTLAEARTTLKDLMKKAA